MNSSPWRFAIKDVPSGWDMRKAPFLGDVPVTGNPRSIANINVKKDRLINKKRPP
jgi:hypothetical protein